MPFVAIEVVEGLPPSAKRALVTDVAELVAEIMESPVDRIRVRVSESPVDCWSTGGVPAADVAGPEGLPAAEQAPFISFDILEGRPLGQKHDLIRRVSAAVADIVGCPVGRVRMRLGELSPDLWGIGGVPAAQKRADEVERRRVTTTDRAS